MQRECPPGGRAGGPGRAGGLLRRAGGLVRSSPGRRNTGSALKSRTGADAGGCGMLFLHPMWDYESQRIGKQRCTPTGYTLHVVAELIGFVGMLLLLGVVALLVWWGIAGDFRSADLWLLALPFGLGIGSEVLFQ